MKISKISAVIAAAAMAVSMMAVNASATNWANTSYADNDPNTVKIIATDENKVDFTATANGVAAKARIEAQELLDDPTAVKSATWKITYTIPEGTAAGNGLGGGCYFGCKNSTGYWLSPDYDEAGNAYWANTTYTLEDSAKFLLGTEKLEVGSELVFMDWSSHEAMSNITVTISDLKFFDADGNEIAQKAYGASAAEEEAPAEEATTEEAPAEEATTEEAPAEEATTEEAPAEEVVEEAAPEADASTEVAATGNVAVASIAAVMALAGAAALVSKKRN
ncbi:MAG: hypothetical protein J6K17_04410 [Oscillospiraceae bacterium]|nr:hypothetical protein [Oscillospiraceae bacterium]MBR4096670.1 hypothetical protein [Oscillospiraceae bacterium]